ncbi:single-stranded DNA-binding protein [Arthrobacter russicus]|jgi:single-strand DNA-binding protein|uniref:Single-stranded DNA-binding protein n=1 Tax=Arthrobacter russicus TaxID=172040 RepID=A0ABU1J6W0_9MICC|nr:single-stranded DNA-binding protein [Arthrobacter russicus]MDR6268166.1 single-strand DNA-binding protein [Arthrobacter russicus]
MSDVVTVRGFVASEVKMTLTESGLPVANFRLGSTERRFDRGRNQWIDAATNWYSVSMFRALAQNASASISKGERVIVTGKLKLRQWRKDDGRRGIAPEIDADAVGHDLVWGTAKFRRAVQTSQISAESSEPSESSGPSGQPGDSSGGAAADPPSGTLLSQAEDSGEPVDRDDRDSEPEQAEDGAEDVESPVHAPY